MAKKLIVEDNSTSPVVIYQEEIPEGFTDYSDDPVMWYNHGGKITDFIFWRYKIESLLVLSIHPNYPVFDYSGWANLNSELKSICAELFITLIPYNLRVPDVVSENQDYNNWEILISLSKGIEKETITHTGRAFIVEKMRRCVSHRVRTGDLPMSETQQFYRDVKDYLVNYIEAADPAFKCWIFGLSPYINDFEEKSYYSENLKNELMEIYNGEY